MPRPDLSELGDFLKWDGSLRDIYVFEADAAAWLQFVELIKRLPHTFFQGDKNTILHFDDIFFEQTESCLLTIYPNKLDLNCHFFTLQEIEIDLDIRCLANRLNQDLLLDFVEALANAVNKPVSITPENQSALPYITYTHANGDWVKAYDRT
ncbi:MAG: hypothetical protein H7X92_01625 [Chitinophagales bacterium]|nr:hypothetical protein [Hyphomicrobiales bacterium]